jgi:hypothetical protein
LDDAAEGFHFEVETGSLPARVKYPESVGFCLAPGVLKPGRNGRTRLILSLADVRFRDVFHALGEDIIETMSTAANEKEAVEKLLSRLARWQDFLRRHGATGLSMEERRGLYGELFLLRTELAEHAGPSAAVYAWTGSRGTNHDFQFEACSVEVKTSHAATPHAFHVSNIRQLSDDSVNALYLYFVAVEESEAAQESLPEIIGAIRSVLGYSERTAFDESLTRVGYLNEQEELYRSPRYSTRWTKCFVVGPDFPRLREEMLPNGVEEVRYEVALAACAPFERPICELLNHIAAHES